RGEKENALVVKIEWDAAIGQRVAEERLPLPMPEVVAVAPSSVVEAPAAENAAAAPPPEPLHVPVTPPHEHHPERHGPPDSGPHGRRPPRGGRHEPPVPRGEALRTHPHAEFLKAVTADALARLLVPSLEREIRRERTQ